MAKWEAVEISHLVMIIRNYLYPDLDDQFRPSIIIGVFFPSLTRIFD